ncbi:MAG: PEP-CTERM sorting domain-containing protein [Akkermansiaceae bacterium]
MKNYQHSLTALLAVAAISGSSSAAIIGIETFDTNGAIAGQTGGTGFNYDNLNSTVTGTTSDWDNVTGAPSVSGGVLNVNASSAKREFNGNIEGAGGGDGPDTERNGAFRGSGAVFFKWDMTRSNTSSWSGLSSYDFSGGTAEKLFFGVSNGGTDEVRLEISGGGASTDTGLFVADGSTNTFMGVVDFDNDLIGIWLNPDGADNWDGSGGTADGTVAYTGSNWSTAARLGGGNDASFDNLIVGTTFAEVQSVPEPSSTALLGLGGIALLMRRRK